MKIALISPGDRVDKITKPLDTTDIDYTVNPDTVRKYDVILCDTPDRGMAKWYFRARAYRKPILYRMRGDPYFGIDEWIDNKVKKKIMRYLLANVDVTITISQYQAEKYHDKTNVPTKNVRLPKNVKEWPDTKHTDRELRIVTLTNATYWEKVKPILMYAPVINRYLNANGGYWIIGSWTTGNYSNRIRKALSGYNKISYEIQLDAKQEMENSNLMIHVSNFDVFPNAVLEAMASRIPVITNPYIAFTESDAPISIAKPETIKHLLDMPPKRRQELGDKGYRYVKQNHTPEIIGQEYQKAIVGLTNIWTKNHF